MLGKLCLVFLLLWLLFWFYILYIFYIYIYSIYYCLLIYIFFHSGCDLKSWTLRASGNRSNASMAGNTRLLSYCWVEESYLVFEVSTNNRLSRLSHVCFTAFRTFNFIFTVRCFGDVFVWFINELFRTFDIYLYWGAFYSRPDLLELKSMFFTVKLVLLYFFISFSKYENHNCNSLQL